MFHKLECYTAVETIVLKIKEEIVKGNLTKGSKLPPERELAEKFGVGRSTVREAIQMLKIMGLLTVKGGGRGGAFVRETNVSSVADMIQLMLELEVLEWEEVLEVRMAIEPFTSKLAALNRTDEDLEELLDILERSKIAFDDYEEYARSNTQFHMKLAECSHNKLLISLIKAIGKLIVKSGDELIIEQKDFGMVYNDHADIYNSIKEKDQNSAFDLTEQHLLFAKEEYVKKYSANRQ